MSDLTPMMQQYMDIKNEYEDCILFFRMGDFYEMFFDDAKLAAKVLDIALTSRNKGGGEKTPMAGVPAHSADSYIASLINAGYKVAICEQIEDPEEADGLVERDVIRVITPGTVVENEILEDKENNYLSAIDILGDKIGFSYIDISTGEFYVSEFSIQRKEKIWDELDRIQPREVLLVKKIEKSKNFYRYKKKLKFTCNSIQEIKYKTAYKILTEHFQTQSLSGFGCEEKRAATLAAGQILLFLQETQKRTLKHINKITTYNLNEYMLLDATTRRNLELLTTIRDNKREGSLLNIIDRTVTSMGGRLIKKWITQPLIDKGEIKARLSAVNELKNNYMLLTELQDNLDGIYDLERILGKITYESANARDLAALKFSLKKLPFLYENIQKLSSPLIQDLQKKFDPLSDLLKLLDNSIIDDPPLTVREGGLIKDNYSKELDELRKSRREGKEWITNLQEIERKKTGITSLKVGFNKVFGYYIEVTNPNLDKVPENYTRKQTLSNSERYITPDLKEKEALILGAEERINDLEYELFVDIRNKIGENVDRIKQTAAVISRLDVLISFSIVAIENNYNCPEIQDNDIIDIKEGRHPVVEEMLEKTFVPNDTYLDREENRFLIITGPNMSGKSTYMRQVAIIVLLAQIGCFIPAEKAKIGIVDRIFTRVGASDDLTTGQSTFMVEMNEVANIVNNASKRSLIILDEVGRGTSTYDGVSIAWAVSEYINNLEKIGARTLFATHYHELTHLAAEHKGIKNFNVVVEEDKNGVHFLHKIIPGKADQSYGIEVARLAGLPGELIKNAQQILNQLENKNSENYNTQSNTNENIQQLPLFPENHPVLQKLKDMELMDMTPLEAMNFLYELQQELKERGKNYG